VFICVIVLKVKGKGSPYLINVRRVPELILVLGSQPAGDVSHKPSSRLPLLSTRPTVTLAILKRAATSFAAWWTEAWWVWTVCPRLLPDNVAAAIWTQALLRGVLVLDSCICSSVRMWNDCVCDILCVLAAKTEDIRWRWTEALSYEKKKGRHEFGIVHHFETFINVFTITVCWLASFIMCCMGNMFWIYAEICWQGFEDNIRKNRTVMTNWLKYAAWEESQLELQR